MIGVACKDLAPPERPLLSGRNRGQFFVLQVSSCLQVLFLHSEHRCTIAPEAAYQRRGSGMAAVTSSLQMALSGLSMDGGMAWSGLGC